MQRITITEVAMLAVIMIALIACDDFDYQQHNRDKYKSYALPTMAELIESEADIMGLTQKADVGRELFFTKFPVYNEDSLGLLRVDSVTCAQCHEPKFGFTAGVQMSIGAFDDLPPIKSPTAIGVAGSNLLLYNGAAGYSEANAPFIKEDQITGNNLYGVKGRIAQALFAMSDMAHGMKVEADDIPEHILVKLRQCYPKVADNVLQSDIILAECFAAFEIFQLMPYGSRFEAWLDGRAQLSLDEIQGLHKFAANCATCHTPPFMGSDEFYAIPGFGPMVNHLHDGTHPVNKGRASFTGYPEDEGKFRTVRLNTNLHDQKTYGHGGNDTTVIDAIKAHRLNLTDEDVAKIDLYLQTLLDPNLRKVGSEFQ